MKKPPMIIIDAPPISGEAFALATGISKTRYREIVQFARDRRARLEKKAAPAKRRRTA